MTISKKTLHDLEWPKFLSTMAARCMSEEAAQRCRNLPFLSEDEAWHRINLVNEFIRCIDDDDPPPPLQAEQVQEALIHLASDGEVPREILMAVAVNLKLFVALHRYLENRKDVCPQNAREVLPEGIELNPLSMARLAAEIESTFEPDGSISENASQELYRLKRRATSLRQNLISAMEQLLEKHADVIREKTVTLRNERYVLPVRTDAHHPIRGIVHGSSSSGATMFIEPTEMVEQGNELTLAREEIVREENRILQALRKLVKQQLTEVQYASRKIIEVECLIATARLCWDIDAAVPIRKTPGTMKLLHCRHPLLVLDGVQVIPNHITVTPGSTLLISGPNAGGKTVVLKTAGILALMLKAGIPISASPDSEVGIPDDVLSDIGDDQSLSSNLSTFSAHMKNIAEILGAAQQGSLVLLDELSAGTDPLEGTALAQALLDRFNYVKAATLATTHFDTLKEYARENDAYISAGMGFDAIAKTPNYTLTSGTTGYSSALSTAGQYGIPKRVIDAAREMLPKEVRKLGAAREALEEEKQQLALERAALKEQRKEAEKAKIKYDDKRRSIAKQEQRFINKEQEALWSSIKSAREVVRDAEKTIKRRRTDAKIVKEQQRKINEIASKLAPGQEFSSDADVALPGRAATVDDIVPQARVHVISMKKDGVVDSPLKGNTAYIKIGAIRMRVAITDMRILMGDSNKKKPTDTTPRRAFHAPPILTSDAVRTSANTLDLRGNRVDEGIRRTDAFLDSALISHTDVVYILTGHGTGQLTSGIREHLERSAYVETFRPGTKDEGGDAVTAVWMR
ncbi:MAG: Smr/MutS family protein [Deltaproteobacteria bacterium]|nr:Smr/MutS family protein [Deltaproteobacteria bacterium]MBN2673260.1 Smr/MutS family protein [Deltaproteobacteria bacterium]